MKPLTKQHEKAVRQFIARAPETPLAPVDWILAEVAILRDNTTHHLTRKELSTKQRRDHLAELERLRGVLECMHLDTRETLSHYIMMGIAFARGEHSTLCSGSDFDGLLAAVKMAIDANAATGDRGKGHRASVRRVFVRDAARLFVMAGFKTIGQTDESRFTEWLDLMQRIVAVPSFSVKYGSLKRAIRDTIGNTAAARKDWVDKESASIQRMFFQALNRNI